MINLNLSKKIKRRHQKKLLRKKQKLNKAKSPKRRNQKKKRRKKLRLRAKSKRKVAISLI
jgi:hypothetical protein